MDERKKYNVTEFAKLCGVTPRTLKYYEEIGLFQPETVGDNGYRLYNVGQLDEISAIRLFREHGLSLKEIKEMLSGDDVESICKRLEKQQEILEKKLAELRKQQYFVEHTLHLVQMAEEHMEEPFWENCEPRRIHCVPHDAMMVNYLLQGYGNGAILDGETFELRGTYRTAEDGEILLAGKCLTFYCMGAPMQSGEKLSVLLQRAKAEGLASGEIFCEEILERAGGGQGLFRYFCVEKQTRI
ncbi:MAG: MerR family transcriptional regulator [Acetatifactor sp.]